MQKDGQSDLPKSMPPKDIVPTSFDLKSNRLGLMLDCGLNTFVVAWGCKNYIGSHTVDGASNAGASVDALSWNASGKNPRK